jgi:hypothetical protein
VIILGAVALAMVVVAAVLIVAMFRRDDPVLGVAGLVVAVSAALPAGLYGGLGSL